MFRQLIPVICLLICASACHPDSTDIKPLYYQYTFDKKVIDKLPLYDSLVNAILEQSDFFQKSINENESYRSYRYMPSEDDTAQESHLPEAVGPRINQYYNQLGKDFIYGFDVFKDSSIKIYIRRSESDTRIDILENLSYYPAGSHMQERKFPSKDTLLTRHWQYWVFFSKSRLPF